MGWNTASRNYLAPAAIGAFLAKDPSATKAFDVAYADVLEAFDTFIKNVPENEPVILVGHSQGGTIVQMAAADRGVRATYDVGSVVSFSSPTPAGTVPEDPDVNHLELSNTTDIVPMLDGVPPAAGANHVNVYVQDSKLGDENLREKSSDQGGRHSLATAVAVSEAAQRGTDPSLRRSLARLADDLSGGPAPATGLGTPGETPLRSMLDGGIQIFEVTAR